MGMISRSFGTYVQNGFVEHRKDFDCSVSSTAFRHSLCVIDSVQLLSCYVQQPLKQMSQSQQLLRRPVLDMSMRTTLSIMSCLT